MAGKIKYTYSAKKIFGKPVVLKKLNGKVIEKKAVKTYREAKSLANYLNANEESFTPNPGGKDRSAEQKFLDFTQRTKVKRTTKSVDIPKTWIFIGDAPELNYISDKWDGKKRLYKHKLKKHGKLLVSPDGKLALITDLNLNIKKEGLTG